MRSRFSPWVENKYGLPEENCCWCGKPGGAKRIRDGHGNSWCNKRCKRFSDVYTREGQAMVVVYEFGEVSREHR